MVRLICSGHNSFELANLQEKSAKKLCKQQNSNVMKKVVCQILWIPAVLLICLHLACKKSPLSPEEGGTIRLSKFYRNNFLVNHYEYDVNRLVRRISLLPAREGAGTIDFTYDGYGRIQQYRAEQNNVDVYYTTDVSYYPNDDIKLKVRKTFRKATHALIAETHTDFSYETVDIGRKITAVTRYMTGIIDTSGINIYYVYWNSAAGQLYGNLFEEHELNAIGDTTYSIYYQYSTSNDPLKPDVTSSNPYIYTNLYGYYNVKTSPNVPVKEIYYGEQSFGTRLKTIYHHQYSLNPQNNLIELDRQWYLLYERPDSTIEKYEYSRLN